MTSVQFLSSLRSLGQRGGPADATLLPGAPTSLVLGAVTATTQALTWAAPSAGAAPTGYLVQVRTSAGPGVWQPGGSPTVTSATVTGLSAATSYDYRVIAVNAAGSGPASSLVTGSTAAGGFNPSLDFSDARNGQYAPALAA